MVASLVVNMILMARVLVVPMIDVLHTVNLEAKTSVLEVEHHTTPNQEGNQTTEIPMVANPVVNMIPMGGE